MVRHAAILVVGVLACLSCTALYAEPPDIHVDVPADHRDLEVNVIEHDFGPGQGWGWHIHHGVEIAYVLSGEFNIEISGSPIRHLKQGDYYEVDQDVPHKVTNAGTTNAALLITYLKDRKGPWKIDVPAPAIH